MVKTYQKLQFKLYLKPFFFFAILKSLVGITYNRHFIVMPQSSSPHEDTLVSEFRGLPKDASTAALPRGGGVTEKEIARRWRDGEEKKTG